MYSGRCGRRKKNSTAGQNKTLAEMVSSPMQAIPACFFSKVQDPAGKDSPRQGTHGREGAVLTSI